MRLYGREGRSSLACLPALWANADRWALKERTRCADNTLICLGCNGKETAASVTKLLLLVMVTCNQGKDLLRPIDSEVCSLPTWEHNIHMSVSLVLFCPDLFHLGDARAGLYRVKYIYFDPKSSPKLLDFFRRQCYRYRVFFILIAHTNACSHKVQYKPPFIQPDAFT